MGVVPSIPAHLPAREATRARVYELLSGQQVKSRPQLADESRLSRATIAVVTEDMIRKGLVCEVGAGDSRGGRPPILLRQNESAAYTIGASLYDYRWHVVATDLAGAVIDREWVDIGATDAETAVTGLGDGIERLRERLDPQRMLPLIGVGSPGLVDVSSGIVKSATDLGWRDVPIGERITERTGLPCAVVNRSKAGALAAYWHIARRAVDHLIFISIGTGVSAGIVQQGRLFLGANSSAGELGHVTILPDGPRCECGNRGCLQELISERAIASSARAALRANPNSVLVETCGHHPETLTAFQVLEAAELGDTTAVSVVETISGYLTVAVANLINLFNPQLIILGGPVAEHSPRLVESVSRSVGSRAMAYPLSVARIVGNELGPETGAIGAAVLVLENAPRLILQLPIYR